MNEDPRARWKYVALPVLIVVFLAVYPQLNVWMAKGSSWHGAYVVSNYDEVAYSSYVNALISGRPRKTDPFVGKDDVEGETLYSIQFIPAYTTAYLARGLGLSASTVFILLNFLIAIFSALAVFFFLRLVTCDDLVSSAGTLAILCLGTAVTFQGELQHMILGNYLCDFFPFLRRYQPGFAFPIFFAFASLSWKMLNVDENRKGLLYAAAAGGVFVVLVYSYFYLWTAALAWFGTLTLLWLLARTPDRLQTIIRSSVVALLALAAIVPFFVLLSRRVMLMDDVQLLDLTHAPSLFRLPEIIGYLIVLAIVYLARNGKLEWRSPAVLVTLSLALTPVVLFNQQIVTGRSLQPVHYEIFIANYLIMAAIVMLMWIASGAAAGSIMSVNFRRGFLYLGLAAIIWGFVESSASTRRNAGYEGLRDDAMPVLTYLRDNEPAKANERGEYPTVFSTDLMVADFIPTVTSYRSLWTPHTNSAGGVDLAENRELFYRYAYFSGFNEKDLRDAIDGNLYEVMAVLFGGGRALPELSSGAGGITAQEKQSEIAKYKEYVAVFNSAHAAPPRIDYLIVPVKAEPDYKNLDRWYLRDAGQVFGLFKLYHLKPRSE